MAFSQILYYHYTFDVYETPMTSESSHQEEEEKEEEDNSFALEFNFLRLNYTSSSPEPVSSIELGRRQCNIPHVDDDDDGPTKMILKASEYLNELSVPKECHAKMITELMRHVMKGVVKVAMYVVEGFDLVEEGYVIDKVVRPWMLSYMNVFEIEDVEWGRWWRVMSIEVGDERV